VQRSAPVAGRARGVGGVRGAQRVLAVNGDKGVQPGAVSLDAGQVELYEIPGSLPGRFMDRLEGGIGTQGN